MSYADVAKLADALDLGSSGQPWGFKSSHPHQIKTSYASLFCIVLRGLEKEAAEQGAG